MNIQREEILVKQLTSGTTVLFFSTHLSPEFNLGTNPPFEPSDLSPSILEFDQYGQALRLSTFDGVNIWRMNQDNVYQPITSFTQNYLTGYSYMQDYERVLPQNRIDSLQAAFAETVTNLVNQTSGVTYGDTRYDNVFHKFHEIDDFFVNIKLSRSFATLDTLDIYNNAVNSMPNQEGDTGVVFGRLMARQNIKDEVGNNIKVPLVNVPIGVFNPSETYPTSSSVDENGDKIFLNTKESSLPEEYFNPESFSADTENYLRSTSSFTNVPEHYKYITRTNENGEFIIYDVPVGTQIVVYEIDLFKQGLTKDEIALNFFPFPSNDSSSIDNIPSYVFKQFPIDVVPSWGTSQTGYTELNITTNTDLRKWSTFYVSPMSYKGNKLGSIDLFNVSPSLNVEIRDMSKPGFPKTNIPVVEVQNITDKDDSQKLLWSNEFLQIKGVVRFFDHGFKAFKVRANMYDPYGYRTDSDGSPVISPYSKGVWISGYQFKMYYNEPDSIFRTTGFQIDWGFPNNGWIGRDNFHLNRNINTDVKNTEQPSNFQPPYDRPWSHLYPEKYKIPKRPVQKNFERNVYSTRLVNSNGDAYLEQPEYLDGDLVGLSVVNPNPPVSLNNGSGGFGVQYSSENVYWLSNRFSKEVTKGYLYKYEAGVAWNETYSNGFEPSNPSYPVQPGISQVIDGEKFQRVECGYGYWLKPGGWPPVSVEPWGDTIFSRATTPGVGLTSSFGPGVMNVGQSNGNVVCVANNVFIDVYNIEDKDLAVALDDDASLSEGPLQIYRIIDPMDLIPQGPDIVPTYAVYNFQGIYYQRGGNGDRIKTATKNSGNDQEEAFSQYGVGANASFNYQYLKLKITNNGSLKVSIPNTSVELEPGQSAVLGSSEISINNLSLKLPGNSNFDFVNGKYTVANYTFEFIDVIHLKDDGSAWGNASQSALYNQSILGSSVAAAVSAPNYYLLTRYVNVATQYDGNSCDSNGGYFVPTFNASDRWQTVRMNGALFRTPNTNNEGDLYDIRFWSAPITPICGANSFNDGLTSIPIQLD
jgi:hypothetical protein